MRPRNGFSLIELVFALMISSMLLVTIMGLTARLSQASKKLREIHAVKPWVSVLRTQLEKDYRHANSIVVYPKQILIQANSVPHSFLQTEEDSFALQVPLLITYRIVGIDGEQILYRTETRLDRSPSDNQLRQLMCQGVNGFSLERPLDTDVPPGIVELTVHGTDELHKPVLNVVLVRHGARDL